MKQETKDELMSLLYDAKQGLKYTIAVIAIILAAGWVWNRCDAQSIELNVASLSSMADANQSATSIGLNVSAPFNRIFSMAIDSEVSMGTTYSKTAIDNSSVVASLRTDITSLMHLEGSPRLELRTGIGWGHTFGNSVTDHNFHIYSIGLSFSHEVMPRTSIYLSPVACWRSYAEHIGFNRNRGWVRFEAGVKLRIR